MYGSLSKPGDRPPPYSTSIVPIESVIGAPPTNNGTDAGTDDKQPLLGIANEAIKLEELPVIPEREKLSFHQVGFAQCSCCFFLVVKIKLSSQYDLIDQKTQHKRLLELG